VSFKEKHKYRYSDKKQIKVGLLSGGVPFSYSLDGKEYRNHQICVLKKLKKSQI